MYKDNFWFVDINSYVPLDLTQDNLFLVFTHLLSTLRRAETFRSARIPAENEEQMWIKTNKMG